MKIHRPYGGVALIETDAGSVLLGAPTDAFKATKQYCEQHSVAFPRVLVQPPQSLLGAASQFNPEFFLYDFLFIYGAAFKPEHAGERLQLVVGERDVNRELDALRMTLVGPNRDEMRNYDAGTVTGEDLEFLASVSDQMAIKTPDGAIREIPDMVEGRTFNSRGEVDVLDGNVQLTRTPRGFLVREGNQSETIDLFASARSVTPFSTVPLPAQPETPKKFAVKVMGCRSGFDLSGPTTGFLFWVNGRIVMFDGPVGARYLLREQGISFEDIDAVILSHCHEDHMGALVEYVLAPHRPVIYTTEPIYRSALVKLSNYFRKSQNEVKSFINYRRIDLDTPTEILGAQFEFFYTVHAIPTLGVDVRMNDAGREHRIVVSGDTLHHDGLEDYRQKGLVPDATYQRLKHLAPSKKESDSVFLMDVGEAMIHGHPKDWQENPNRVLYYHCPDNEHTRSFGQELAGIGETYTLAPMPKIHATVPGRLLAALSTLCIDSPQTLSRLLGQGSVFSVGQGDVIANGPDRRTMNLLVTGRARIEDSAGTTIGTLLPGEYYGELDGAPDGESLRVIAEVPCEVFRVSNHAIRHWVQEKGLEPTLHRIWDHRPQVKTSTLFADLESNTTSDVAKAASRESYNEGDSIITQGETGDDFYLLLDGEVEVDASGNVVGTIRSDEPQNYFGEISAIFPTRPRSATVRARNRVNVLRIRGDKVRGLFAHNMGVRLNLSKAIEARGG